MVDWGSMALEGAMAVTTVWIALRFFGAFLEKRKRNAQASVVLLVFALCQWAFEHGLGRGTLWIIIVNSGLTLLAAIACFEKAGIKKLFLSLLLTVFWVLVEIILFVILNLAHIAPEPSETIGTIASKVIMIIGVNMVSLLWQKRGGEALPLKYYLALLFIPAGSLYIAFNLQYSAWSNSFALVVTQGLLLLFNVIIFELYFRLGDYFLLEKEQAVFAQQVNSALRNTEEQQKSMHDFREEKHNLANELIVLRNSLEDSGNAAALNSLARIIENFGQGEEILRSGNDTVDTLVNYKYAKAKEAGVEFNMRVFVPDVLPVDQCDLGLLLGNALDNAIEAAAECGPANRHVSIAMNVKKEALVIVIENPYKEIKQDRNGNLATTKENSGNTRGYGLRSIKRVAGKYDGEVLTDFENNVFRLTAILNLLD